MASVKVAVRVRPFNKREINLNSGATVSVNNNTVILNPITKEDGGKRDALGERGTQHKFTFDYSYWSHNPKDAHFVTQEKVFQDLGTDVVENAFGGYNACVFAYGQTGSGKTYTMMGTEEDRGLIPRICKTMFERMATGKEEGTTYRTEVSYLEIYNEKVKDLLQKKPEKFPLKVRESKATGPYVENLSKHLVIDYQEILDLMEQGNDVRTTASTNMNDTSSRSHAIFTITFVNAGFLQGIPHETVSKIHLVDLAGSERADATGATGKRLKEGAHINKSLVTLGSVISALAEASNAMTSSGSRNKNVFIPYRDSTLTWLLKDSLGGNSKTIMIAAISPAEVNHSETLSTLRYANRAKNIINKPTVNEDANVKLIRELRDEIERMKSMLSLDPVVLARVQKELVEKENKERFLTAQWTEKWKEAANILQEQEALALKRTGLGVILDSDKPHLVGIDEDVYSTGITLYHLKNGDTTIGGNENSDIALKGPCIEDQHCVIQLNKDGQVTLIPSSDDALCMVNAALVSSATKLSQGCVVVLGKTNMFRFNDPSEAASMRLNRMNTSAIEGEGNGTASKALTNQSLLSQSLSDLRLSGRLKANYDLDQKLHSSEGNIPENGVIGRVNLNDSTAANRTDEQYKKSREDEENANSILEDSVLDSNESFYSHQPQATATPKRPSVKNEDLSKMHMDRSFMSSGGSPRSSSGAGSGGPPTEEMTDLYKCIGEQKDVIMTCLESETCDIVTLNKQISVLKNMQDHYSKLEFELTRNLWITSQNSSEMSEDNLKSFDEQFSTLVEQEVDRRLFQEKVLKTESEFHERELLRIQKERELDEVRRQHEKEVYLLKKKLFEASNSAQESGKLLNNESQNPSSTPDNTQIRILIPRFHVPSGDHVEFEVIITTKDATWTVFRRFRRFRELHVTQSSLYGPTVTGLNFPSRRLFGNTSETVSHQRQLQLQTYLNGLVQRCALVPASPLYQKPYQASLLEFSTFFEPDASS